MSKTYHIFRFIKNGDSPWECNKLLSFNYVRQYVNGQWATPIQCLLPYSTGLVSDTCCVKMTRFKTIVTVMVEQDDIALAEDKWKEALGDMLDRRNAAFKAAQRSWDRAFSNLDSTNNYTRP